MNQQETSPWVLVSNVKEDTISFDLKMISPQVTQIIDEWQFQGKIIWSGPFNDNQSSMAIFEATGKEAQEFFKKYDLVCSGILNYSLHKWDAMPILSVLSN